MKIEIVAIGNEVLTGFTVNTNAAFLSKSLLSAGFFVTKQSSLPDNSILLKKGLQSALQENDLVIATGGLGPTLDDLTKNVAAEIFDSDFYYDETIAQEILTRYPQLSSIENQATLPTKAKVLKNAAGTAPGFIFTDKEKTLILLPGIPAEMKEMWEKEVFSFIKNKYNQKNKKFSRHLYIYNVREPEVDKFLRELQRKYPHIEIGLYTSQGTVTVLFSIEDADEKRALLNLELPFRETKDRFSLLLYEAPFGKIEEAVHARFLEKNLTLSAAESCTGGAFSSRLTLLPNASQYFMGSVIAYSNLLKSKLLNVPEKDICTYGAVSEEVVRKMYEGILRLTETDYGVAVTGIAGPGGGTLEKPVGLVWCAVGKKDQNPHVFKINAKGNREMVIERSINSVLGKLLEITT